ncbi:MAG: amidohydrolase family protein, partial [Candidatus Aenigmarchaeota archaeon]|nr:amidohydrolase family protein [Candidatus Aenigmarchaeota archaeon]
HAIYTVSGDLLKSMKEIADENNLMYHIHISETKNEVDECIKKNGVTPVKYLDNLGVLGENFIGAHGVWLDEEEIQLLGQRGGCVVHNPVSNMKLAVGSVLDYKGLISNSVNVCLGSDGCASNNNLDMFEEMKVAALLQKSYYNDPTRLCAGEVFDMATVNGYKALGLKGGKIEEGFIADLCLVDLSGVMMIPNHNLVSNLVYSANGSVVDTVVCGGDVLMENRVVKDEDKIVEEGIGAAEEIVGNGS